MNLTISAERTGYILTNGSHLPLPTDDEISMPTETLILTLQILSLVVAMVGLLGNALVLWFLAFRLKRNSFSVYILNLAGADLLFLFLSLGLILSLMEIIYLNNIWDYVNIMWTFAYITDLSILSSISIERCLSVLFPIWHRCQRPRHTSTVTCIILWIWSLLLSILEGDLCGMLITGISMGNYCQTFDFFLAAWLLFLFMVLSVSSVALLVKMVYGFQKMRLTRLYVTIVLTVLIFLLCGLPFGINQYLLSWIPNPFVIIPPSVSLLLSCVNSSANPIIYFFVGSFRQQQQWQTLKMVLQRALQDTPEVELPGENFPQATREMSVQSEV